MAVSKASFSINLEQATSIETAASSSTKRSRAVLLDDGSDGGEEYATETVTHFAHAAGGAYDEKRPKIEQGPLVIDAQLNRRWQDSNSHAKKRHKYENTQASEKAAVLGPSAAKQPIHGLIASTATADRVPEVMAIDTADAASQDVKPRTDHELAMDQLLGKAEQSTLVVPAQSEEEAFQRDYRDAPDMATLAEYAAIPVEKFGAALLRGMGWKEGMGIGNQRTEKLEKSKVPGRRPALLGIGAKADMAIAAELGTWGHADKGRKKADIMYNPLVMRNRRTGEELTEAELQQRMTSQPVRRSSPPRRATDLRRRDDSRDRGISKRKHSPDRDRSDRDTRRQSRERTSNRDRDLSVEYRSSKPRHHERSARDGLRDEDKHHKRTERDRRDDRRDRDRDRDRDRHDRHRHDDRDRHDRRR